MTVAQKAAQGPTHRRSVSIKRKRAAVPYSSVANATIAWYTGSVPLGAPRPKTRAGLPQQVDDDDQRRPQQRRADGQDVGQRRRLRPAQELVIVGELQIAVEQQRAKVRVVVRAVAAIEDAGMIDVGRDQEQGQRDPRRARAAVEPALPQPRPQHGHEQQPRRPLPRPKRDPGVRADDVEDRDRQEDGGEKGAARCDRQLQERNFSDEITPHRWSRNRPAVASVPRP